MPSCFNLAFKQKSRQQNLGNSTVDFTICGRLRITFQGLHQEFSTFVEWLKPLANPWLTLVVTISRMAGGATIPWIVRQVWCFGII
jgi:hypothetical protein